MKALGGYIYCVFLGKINFCKELVLSANELSPSLLVLCNQAWLFSRSVAAAPNPGNALMLFRKSAAKNSQPDLRNSALPHHQWTKSKKSARKSHHLTSTTTESIAESTTSATAVSSKRRRKELKQLALETNNTQLANAIAAFGSGWTLRRKAISTNSDETFLRGAKRGTYFQLFPNGLFNISSEYIVGTNSSFYYMAHDLVSVDQYLLFKNTDTLGLNELECNSQLSNFYSPYFRETTYYGPYWLPIKLEPEPTSSVPPRLHIQSLVDVLLDAESSLDPLQLYLSAKAQLDKAHTSAHVFHGDTRADSFLVVTTTSIDANSVKSSFSVSMIEFVHCGAITSLRFNLMVEDYRQLGEHVYLLIKEREARIRRAVPPSSSSSTHSSSSLPATILNFDAIKELAWQDWKNTVAANHLDIKFGEMFAPGVVGISKGEEEEEEDEVDDDESAWDHFGPLVNTWIDRAYHPVMHEHIESNYLNQHH